MQINRIQSIDNNTNFKAKLDITGEMFFGEVFEKMETEKAGQTWTKDNVPFTIDGDLTVDGIAYQIKYEGATFTNEKTLAKLTA